MGIEAMSTKRKIILLILLAWGLGAPSLTAGAAFLQTGQTAPNFLIESGDNQPLSLHMIQGKVIVLFYEFRHSLGQNQQLKDVLKKFYRVQPPNIKKDVFRLVVIDCSKSSWPTAPIWKSQLREHSRQEGFTIYGDWNRRMFADYHMEPEESNFLIIDKHGIIRYAAAGKIDSGEFEKIKELLLTLVQSK
jgi:hypothetical protein